MEVPLRSVNNNYGSRVLFTRNCKSLHITFQRVSLYFGNDSKIMYFLYFKYVIIKTTKTYTVILVTRLSSRKYVPCL